MPYLGNELATQFQAFVTQTITGDGSTGYTLDRAVANGKELLVYINNVKQEEGSGKSYEASGTTITFSAAVTSSDSCYLVYMGSAQQTVTAPAGSIVSSQFSSADLVLPKTVTIGSAAEEDTKLVFDGNAQDYHVGLDDSEDKLTIGKGTALGTTTSMTFDADGQVLKPLQTYFHVGIDTTGGPTPQSNISNSGYETITLDNEIFDRGGNFASNQFTAPVTGIYHLTLNIRLDDVDTASSYYNLVIQTSNRAYQQLFNYPDSDIPIMMVMFTAIADMDANDVAYCRIFQNGGTSQTDINGYNTSFMGYLLG